MLNKVVLIGRLTKDPELKQTGNGRAFTNITVAVNRNFKNAQGETEADFINVVAWQKTAELICNYLGKGRLVAIDGRIQTRNYENDQGQRVYITEVVAESVQFLDRAPNGSGAQNNEGAYQNQNFKQNSNQNNQQNFNQNTNQSSQQNNVGSQPAPAGKRDIFSDLPF